ncbi:hypothetical protein SCLCIDRAFT_1212438 [Scleroderma citrinum Foug A]|uniref:Stress response RCI peptide n=1 Tax=Scleroderma citrinum Foug A TaxID=1036808 RepID=A0A0C3EA97_9AGAM|nr:hypothetical protein SCLCIDRAFT_1212438 [Scleroderma citrinum Foug A]
MPAKSNKPKAPKVKRYHWYAVVLFIMGTLFPPLAVAARFGIGKDFWLNLLLTICGYIPGHVHNFYVQNIRNNKNHQRTPKWAQRYGLVDTSTIKRHQKRSQWANRYQDRNPQSTLEGQPLEEGQVQPSRSSTRNSRETAANGDGLWRPEDEAYYNQEGSPQASSESGGGRWRYPANFDDTLPVPGDATKKKKKKKDRWARTEDAYAAPSPKKKKKKSRSRPADGDIGSVYSQRSGSTELEVPEDPARTDYRPRDENPAATGGEVRSTEDVFNHEF